MSEPGTFRTTSEVRLESAMRNKADIRRRYEFMSSRPSETTRIFQCHQDRRSPNLGLGFLKVRMSDRCRMDTLVTGTSRSRPATNGDRNGKGLWNWVRDHGDLKYQQPAAMLGSLKRDWACRYYTHSRRPSRCAFPTAQGSEGDVREAPRPAGVVRDHHLAGQ